MKGRGVPVSLTQSQLARQERILEVATRLAAEGGFDAVQMRTIAVEADVALGTLYRYFPSKEHLLVSATLGQLGELAQRLVLRPPMGADPAERVLDVLRRVNATLQREPKLTLAVLRSLTSGHETVIPAVREMRRAMRSIIIVAIGEPTIPRDELVGEVIEAVWLSALVSWLSGVDSHASVTRKLEDATRLLFGDRG
ncbi:MAG: TetR family transcriptional regulator [Microthrixaceae bacterium]|nr:TetR family transcriptional regulator [Microthrixaceae bacterium]